MKNEKCFEICDTSFGYLMYLLNNNHCFSELHLPSLNRINIQGSKLTMNKKVPKKFKKRILEICQIIEFSKMTNLKLVEKLEDDESIYLTTESKIGKINTPEELSQGGKKRIISLFFRYHAEINNKEFKINTEYRSFFNHSKLKKDIKLIKDNIPKRENNFDKNVLDYLKIISSQKFSLRKIKKCNVHGDFILRNIVKIDGEYSIIDLDMVHKGYLEIQFIRLLKELFGFATPLFFKELNKHKHYLNKVRPKELFEIYLHHKILDISAIKSAYLTNKEKYLQLQKHILSQIRFITEMIEKREQLQELFELNLRS